MRELKPCPFCGGAAHIEKNSYLTVFRNHVLYCEECDLYLMLDDVYAKEEDLIDAWNRRVGE